MAYVKTLNGTVTKFPYSIGQFRNDNSSTSFSRHISKEVLESYGVFEVLVDEAPVVDRKNYNAIRNELPVSVNGEWKLNWSVVEKTDEEKQAYYESAAEKVRSKRNALLASSDWIVTKETEKAAIDGLGIQIPTVWADYRQALRDITEHAAFPYLSEADWPTKP